MSQVQFGVEKFSTKKVYYTGTDVLREGYALCYDADLGTAASADPLRAFHVEKPSSSNLENFAGIVTDKGDSKQGPCTVEIFVPEARGQKINVWSGANNVIDSTLLRVKAGSYELDTDGDGPIVAKAMQTVDRSTTSAQAQALLFAPNGYPATEESSGGGEFPALGRTAAQLPTSALWAQFPESSWVLNTDFRGENPMKHEFSDLAAGNTQGRGANGIGEYTATVDTTDNDAAEIVFQAPIIVSGGQPWLFEARVKASQIANTVVGWFLGLQTSSLATGDLIADAGTLADVGSLGFQNKEGDGDILDVVYDNDSQTQNEHDDDWATLAADTYVKVGLHFNGTTIQMYLNGVATGTAISAADIAAADFPSGDVMNPVLLAKGATTTGGSVTLDWIRVAQLAA